MPLALTNEELVHITITKVKGSGTTFDCTINLHEPKRFTDGCAREFYRYVYSPETWKIALRAIGERGRQIIDRIFINDSRVAWARISPNVLMLRLTIAEDWNAVEAHLIEVLTDEFKETIIVERTLVH